LRYAADISPAIRELKKLHFALLDHIEKGAPSGPLGGLEEAKNTVISVVPRDRRIEDGWYKWRMWESKTEDVLHELDPRHTPQRYHEVFISGEALSKSAEELVLLMMHQVTHQAAGVASVYTYHGDWMLAWQERLWGIPREATLREPIQGWVKIDRSKLPDATKDFVRKMASKIDMTNIDLYRQPMRSQTTTGKMYLWHCDGCPRPVKLRTGAILYGTCDKCGQPFKFRDALKVSNEYLSRIPIERRA